MSAREKELEAEVVRLREELEQFRGSTFTLAPARGCRCGKFTLDVYPNGLLLKGGTCGRDVLHTATGCGPPPAPAIPQPAPDVQAALADALEALIAQADTGHPGELSDGAPCDCGLHIAIRNAKGALLLARRKP